MTLPENLLCCPVCRVGLDASAEGFGCSGCGRRYPRVLGFLDFRAEIPAGFDAGEDLRIAGLLAGEEGRRTFAELVDYYYQLCPPANASLHARHMAHFAVEQEQAEAAVRELAAGRSDTRAEALLDIGCGLGQYLKTALEIFGSAAGVDLALTQLVLARKHLSEAGRSALLVAARSEQLPFRPESFAVATAADTIEHVADSDATVSEVARVLQAGGRFYLSTPNRFSLSPEPHVGIWGLGYWPRAWAVRRVQKKLGVRYDDIRLFSYWRLRRLLSRHFPGSCQVRLPQIGLREAESFSPAKRRWAGAYGALRRAPGLRAPLYVVTPFFHGLCVKREPFR